MAGNDKYVISTVNKPEKLPADQFESSDNNGAIIEIDKETGEMRTTTAGQADYQNLLGRVVQGDDVVIKNIDAQTQVAGLKAAVHLSNALEDDVIQQNPMFLKEAISGIKMLRDTFLGQSAAAVEGDDDYDKFRTLLQSRAQN